MKESFWLTLKNYWYNGLDTTWTFYVPLIMLGIFVLSSFFIYLFRQRSDKTEIIKALSSVYFGGIATIILTLIVTIWLMHFTTFFGKFFCQMGFLIGFLIVLVLTIVTYYKICQHGKTHNSYALGFSVTGSEKLEKYQKFKRYCWILWFWSLLLALPFAILSIPNKSKHLISIVLDNSGSMNDNLKQCTNALEAALLATHKNADYVFTTIDYTKDNSVLDRAVKEALQKDKTLVQFVSSYFDEFVNQKSSWAFSTNTVVYNNILSLFNSFSQMGIAESGSPVYEGIWHNYLESRNLAQVGGYESKKMIVITDGVDNLYAWLNNDTNEGKSAKLLNKDIFQQKGKVGQTANDFYTSICTINYGDYEDDLLFKDCESSIDEVYDGKDERSYFDAFRSFLPEMYFDILFIYILVGFFSLFIIIMLIIKSIKL